MRTFGLVALAVLLLVLSGVMQVTMGYRISVFGAYPELSLVVLVSLSLLVRPAWGALSGFVSGVLLGAFAGASMAYYVATRALCGFGCGYAGELEPEPKTAAAIAMGATLLTQLVFMVFAPTLDIGEYVRVTLIQSVLNGILTWPVYAGLRRVYRPKVV